VTPFQRAVATVLERLGPGEVATYGEIASEAGYPGAHRAVGTFLRDHDGYPWWRVVRSDGRFASSDHAEQARRLAAEGVPTRNGRVMR
jgi:methylated-DNA-protein-cysteine methyltransferase-like protein